MDMNKRLKYIVFTLIALLGMSCTKKICPAYQSYFLLDKESQDSFFTYFEEQKQEEGGTAITDIHHEGGSPNLSTDFDYNSANKPREDFPIQPSKKNKNGLSMGPTVKRKKSKSYKKRFYVVPMRDVYVEDSTGGGNNFSDSLRVDNFQDSDTTSFSGGF